MVYKGNQTFGRPAFDRMQIGKEFVEWAKDNPEALTVPCFTAYRDMTSDILMQWAMEDKDFSKLYRQGLELIGINRLKMSMGDKPAMSQAVYLKSIRRYDKTEQKEWEKDVEFEAQAKAPKDTAQEKEVAGFRSFEQARQASHTSDHLPGIPGDGCK